MTQATAESQALIIVGYTVDAIADHDEYVRPPQPPKTITKPETLAAWHAGEGRVKKETARVVSAFSKLTGRVTSIFAVDPQLGQVFVAPAEPGDKPAVSFLAWVTKNYPHAFSSQLDGPHHQGVVLMGFDPKQFVRVAGTEAILHGGPTVPLGFWYQNESVYDPYDMLVESNRRDVFDIFSVARMLGIKLADSWQAHQDAMTDAILAAELVYRCQLFPSSEAQQQASRARDLLLLMARSAAQPEAEDPSPEETAAATTQGASADAEPSLEAAGTADSAPVTRRPRRPVAPA